MPAARGSATPRRRCRAPIVGIGALFGGPLPTHWPAVAAALVLGAASFCALGVAVASLIRNSGTAPAVVQLVLFPLAFISGSYFPSTPRC